MASTFDAVACANASGFSAARYQLPPPQFTVLSSIVLTGKNESNRQALRELGSLQTGRVYLFPRRPYRNKLWKQLLHPAKMIRSTPFFAIRQLRRTGYQFEEFVARPAGEYLQAVSSLAGDDPRLQRLMAEKVPSVGVIAVALGLADYRYERVVLSGFSFEITHAHAVNPLIAARGSTESRHAETDVIALGLISRHTGGVFTTEPVVHQRTGIPLLEG
ncbi:hypothetical protein [Defluviicoccus vanus]|uniref:Uncharacterized protein n=1 Tax=Defluviicoccus vanus TaxID=111831 RepID=A0A7H1MZS4_9PROT|nr:hypothetical protein [Defluviicoccus vanus]QNT68960.1 hypothetical protein HQ394_05800 [Defluviicoccus vanus]